MIKDARLNATGAVVNSTVTSEAIRVMDIKDPYSSYSLCHWSGQRDNKGVHLYSGQNAGNCATSPSATGTANGAAITITDGNYIALQTKAAATANTEVKVTVTVGGASRHLERENSAINLGPMTSCRGA